MTTKPDLRTCAACGTPRGNVRRGWHFATREGVEVSCTCPACPTAREPIRRVEGARGVRYRAVVDATPRGARQRKQRTSTFATLEDARAFVDEVREAVARDGAYAPNAETVAQLLDRFLATPMRAVTRDGYASAVRPVRVRLGDVLVRELRPADVDDFVQWAEREGGAHRRSDDDPRGKPLSARSVRYAVTTLGAAYRLAVRDGIVSTSPTEGVRLPPLRRAVGEDVAHWPTQGSGPTAQCEHLKAFIRAADDDALGGLLRLSAAGLTRADVGGLRWSDVDLDAGTVRVRQGRVLLADGSSAIDAPKSEQRRRTVPVERIHPGTIAALRRLRAQQAADRLAAGSSWHDSGLVYVDALGRPASLEGYSDRFRRVVAAAGLPDIHLHALRHSLAQLLIRRGATIDAAAALLGHTKAVFVSTYLPDGSAAGIDAAAAVLDGMHSAAS